MCTVVFVLLTLYICSCFDYWSTHYYRGMHHSFTDSFLLLLIIIFTFSRPSREDVQASEVFPSTYLLDFRSMYLITPAHKVIETRRVSILNYFQHKNYCSWWQTLEANFYIIFLTMMIGVIILVLVKKSMCLLAVYFPSANSSLYLEERNEIKIKLIMCSNANMWIFLRSMGYDWRCSAYTLQLSDSTLTFSPFLNPSDAADDFKN